jgi:hypothetical protein
MHNAVTWSLVLGATLGLACGTGTQGAGNGDGGTTKGDGGTTGDGGLGSDGDVTPPIDDHCKRVDIVFSVDNSSSMDEEKTALSTIVFPEFAKALRLVGGGADDYRIGVLDACPRHADYRTTNSAGTSCAFTGGQVWMESKGNAKLEAEFQCAGNVFSYPFQNGTSTDCHGESDDEQPASTASSSLEDPWKSGDNKGFLRTDALLVVIAITDEDEQPVYQTAQSAREIYDRLVAIKGGDVKQMVFLGIGGEKSCGKTDFNYGGAQEATKLKAIAELFKAEGRGVFWDLCAGHLEDGLTEAMAVINKACDEFPPIE